MLVTHDEECLLITPHSLEVALMIQPRTDTKYNEDTFIKNMGTLNLKHTMYRNILNERH